MKIISWNMDFYQKDQSKSWEFLINAVDADIALLQEVVFESVPEKFENNILCAQSHTSKEYNKTHPNNNNISWGTAIYLKPNFCDKVICKTNEMFPSEIETGKAVAASISINGKEFIFASIHTDTRKLTNEKYDLKFGLEHLKRIFQTTDILNMKNLVIGGDFNADKIMFDNYFDKNFFGPILKNSNLTECEPKDKITFFRAKAHDDHIYISKDLQNMLKQQDDRYNAFTWNYGKIKSYSDHTIVEINFEV